MKTNPFTLFIICLCYLFCFNQAWGQSKNKDKVKPIVNLSAPEDGATFKIGQRGGVHFAMELVDNEELATYRLQISPDFKKTKSKNGEQTVDYSFDETYDVSGKDKAKIHHHDVQPPVGSTPGKYSFTIICTDAAGNKTKVVRQIILN